ncbi:MAG: metQ 4 [Firmicutes bacterium]|nr:metQ 4 [Bacillota bacterium]
MRFCSIFLVLLSIFILSGCSKQPSQPVDLKIGVTPGQHSAILKEVEKVARNRGLSIELVEYTDYLALNQALAHGDIDLNSFQPEAYLTEIARSQHYNIRPIAKTIIHPIGIYSKVYHNLSQIESGATLALPNDPVNQTRVLLLLEKAGLLTLRHNASSTPMLEDVISNPLTLRFKELNANHTVEALETCELAAISAGYIANAGLVPMRDALLFEDASSPYTHVLAARINDANPALQRLVDAYHSPPVKDFINKTYQGSLQACW